jgi:hypothetical protein
MTVNEAINLEAILKEADALIHRMQNDTRELHGLTWEVPEFKEITDRCNKVWDHLGDMQLAMAELGELYRTVPKAHRR